MNEQDNSRHCGRMETSTFRVWGLGFSGLLRMTVENQKLRGAHDIFVRDPETLRP